MDYPWNQEIHLCLNKEPVIKILPRLQRDRTFI